MSLNYLFIVHHSFITPVGHGRAYKKGNSNASEHSSSISTADMNMIVDKLKSQRNRSTTRANYYCIWKNFNEFVVCLDVKPNSWEERLTLYVAFLIQNDKKSTMVCSYISAIKAVLRDDGENLNEDRVLLSSLTSACKLKNDRVQTRLPIKRRLLGIILQTIESIYTEPQPYLVAMYRALFATAYFGLFRVCELTLTNSGHAVKAKDVHLGDNKDKLMFMLHTSKTHWKDSKPQIIKINSMDFEATGKRVDSRSENIEVYEFCPYQLLKEFLSFRKWRKDNTEQFFVFRDRSPVSAQHFRTMLRSVLEKLRLDYTVYGTHSLREGCAGDLFELGISVLVIKKLGRWQSNIVYQYLKQ